MQIFYGIVVLLSCIICILPPGHVAQQDSNGTTTASRQNCSRVERCNGTETDVHVCATNGQSCKLFPSECELHRANCNRTLATAWNRTAAIQCTSIPSNATGPCACSNQSLALHCSNQTVTTGICAHGGFGYRIRLCHLYRTECDLRRARCNGEDWQTLDSRQCRGFTYNQTKPCLCPNLVECSSNGTPVCVQMGSRGCSLYASKCDVERLRCDGESLREVDFGQCRNMQVGQSGDCHCPAALHCQRNNTNICVRNAEGKCHLMPNECDWEQRKCSGSNFTETNPLHCHNFPVNSTRNCLCPRLLNCARNSSAICVRRQNQQCQLLADKCELEEAKCKGENLTIISPLHCKNFTVDFTGNCSCPNLLSCQRNSRAICVRLQDHRCQLLKNNCELEQAKCEGRNITVIPKGQCKLLSTGHKGNCWCPGLFNCQTDTSPICAKSEDGCQLITNKCKLEEMKCNGEHVNITNMVQCQNFRIGQMRACKCPRLVNCSRNNSTNVCVRGRRGCLRMADACEFEIAKCRGESWILQDAVQCQKFAIGYIGRCTCQRLNNCSRDIIHNSCYQKGSQCKHLRNQCEVERLRCADRGFAAAPQSRCRGIRRGATSACRCPELRRCNRRRTVCGNNGRLCKLFRNECELQRAVCQGERYLITDRNECKCVGTRRTGRCFQEPTCRVPEGSAREICARFRGALTWFNSRCELRHYNYETCTNCSGQPVCPDK